MRSDNSDSDSSIEMLDGIHVPTKIVKQIPSASTANTSSQQTAKTLVHSFFLNDFSTKTTVFKAQSTLLNDQDTSTTTRQAPMQCILPQRLVQDNNPPSATNAPQLRPYSTMNIQRELPNIALFNSCNPEQAPIPKSRPFIKAKKPSSISRESSSSTQTSSTSTVKGDSPLPVYSFLEYENPPAVVYTKSENEANTLVQTLKGPLGFDLEWRVMWQPGAQERRTALVQLCDHDTILLIQVSSMKRFPRKVLEVIESASVVKTGANILNDGEKLYRDFGIQARGLVELGAFAKKADDKFSSVYNREIVSLAKMVAMYLDRTLLKGKVRTSNWEANLSDQMTEYAANDCHCALMVYDRLEAIATQAGKVVATSSYSCHVVPRSLRFKNASQPQPPVPVSLDASTKLLPDYCTPEPPRPQQLRAYKLWHVDKMSLDQMCMKLPMGGRVEPLKKSTVISYIIGALQADPRLPFDVKELKALVLSDASSWQRHQQWIASRE